LIIPCISESCRSQLLGVQLLLAPDCPHAGRARTVLSECLDQLGLDIPVRERVGGYPSPTILVDGVDVMTDTAGAPRLQACRLDVPTVSRVLAALRRRSATPLFEKTS
jgi:hypothetical protein